MDLSHPLLASLLLMAPPLLRQSCFSNGGYDPTHQEAGREVHSHDKNGDEASLEAVDGCAHSVSARK